VPSVQACYGPLRDSVRTPVPVMDVS